MPYATDQGSYAFPQKLLSLATDQQENPYQKRKHLWHTYL